MSLSPSLSSPLANEARHLSCAQSACTDAILGSPATSDARSHADDDDDAPDSAEGRSSRARGRI